MERFAQHPFPPLSPLCYRTEYLSVGAVNQGVVERLQVDAGGVFGGMSHRFADGCHRNVLTLGDACPGVTCHVGGKLGGEFQLFAQLLQMMVDEVNLVPVLPGLVLTGAGDDGQQVRGIVALVFVHQLLHAGFPADVDALPRLRRQ